MKNYHVVVNTVKMDNSGVIMININKKLYNDRMVFDVSGRLDIETAHELEEELDKNISKMKELVFNFKDLDYISSAGVRVVLKCRKQGRLIVKNLNENIMDVLKITEVIKVLEIQ